MEHRCGERILMNLAATVLTGRGEAIRGTIRNLSCGGAFLAIAVPASVPRGLVEVELQLPYAQGQSRCWRAFVVHQQADGIGLMFDDLYLGDLLPLLAAQKAMQRMATGGLADGG